MILCRDNNLAYYRKKEYKSSQDFTFKVAEQFQKVIKLLIESGCFPSATGSFYIEDKEP